MKLASNIELDIHDYLQKVVVTCNTEKEYNDVLNKFNAYSNLRFDKARLLGSVRNTYGDDLLFDVDLSAQSLAIAQQSASVMSYKGFLEFYEKAEDTRQRMIEEEDIAIAEAMNQILNFGKEDQ